MNTVKSFAALVSALVLIAALGCASSRTHESVNNDMHVK